MAVSKFSFLTLFLLCSFAHSQQQQELTIDSLIDGCFTFQNLLLDTTKDPVLATDSIENNAQNADCPCKSAVMKYSVEQDDDGKTSKLLSGQFSILGKEKIVLPIAVQKQMIVPNASITLSFSSANNQ